MHQIILVSVLMTAFNREKYIAEAIESVLSSTYNNWELIIVDDKSNDSTVDIAKCYAEKDKRIKVYVNEVNLGDYPNRNKAASYAKGKYLKYLDSDDTIEPFGLEAFVNAMEEHPDAAFGLSLGSFYKGTGSLLKKPHNIFYEHFSGKGLLNCGPSGSIIRKDIFDRFSGFSGKRYIGDTEFFLKVGSVQSMVVVESDLINWREHDDQEFVKGSKDKDYVFLRLKLALDVLLNLNSPLGLISRSRFLYNQIKIFYMNIILIKEHQNLRLKEILYRIIRS